MSLCIWLGGVQPNVRDGYEEHHDQPVCPNCLTPNPLAIHADGRCETCDPTVAGCAEYAITAGYSTVQFLAAARWYREGNPDRTAQELKGHMDSRPGEVAASIRDTDYAEAEALRSRIVAGVPKLANPSGREVALYQLCRMRLCHANHLDLLYSAWDWEPVKEPEARGRFVGQKGERIELTVTCSKVVDLGVGDYGQKFLAILSDEEGNRLSWFTGENLFMDEGFSYHVRGTVKGHEVYNGVRQTIITRVKKRDQ